MTATVISFLIGVALWPMLEYLLHNVLGHKARGKNLFSREHLKHHAEKDLFAPAYKKAIAAIPVLLATWLVSYTFFGLSIALGTTIGFALMYLTYEVVHRRAHTHAPTGPYSRWVRRNHFYHHFMSPRSNHGVTSPVFDMLCGTYKKPTVIAVPERFAMNWLLDEAGEIKAEYQQDYQLKKARRKRDSEEDYHAAVAGEAPAA